MTMANYDAAFHLHQNINIPITFNTIIVFAALQMLVFSSGNAYLVIKKWSFVFDCFSHSYSHCLWHLPKAACELSEALRNLTLKLYSDHLSEDGKVMHCFTNSSHTAYQTDAKPCSMDSSQTRTLHALDIWCSWRVNDLSIVMLVLCFK